MECHPNNFKAQFVMRGDSYGLQNIRFGSYKTIAHIFCSTSSIQLSPYLQPLSCWRGFPVRWTFCRRWHPSRLSHTVWSSEGNVGKQLCLLSVFFFSVSLLPVCSSRDLWTYCKHLIFTEPFNIHATTILPLWKQPQCHIMDGSFYASKFGACTFLTIPTSFVEWI